MPLRARVFRLRFECGHAGPRPTLHDRRALTKQKHGLRRITVCVATSQATYPYGMVVWSVVLLTAPRVEENAGLFRRRAVLNLVALTTHPRQNFSNGCMAPNFAQHIELLTKKRNSLLKSYSIQPNQNDFAIHTRAASHPSTS
jgi:hypothetical protein